MITQAEVKYLFGECKVLGISPMMGLGILYCLLNCLSSTVNGQLPEAED